MVGNYYFNGLTRYSLKLGPGWLITIQYLHSWHIKKIFWKYNHKIVTGIEAEYQPDAGSTKHLVNICEKIDRVLTVPPFIIHGIVRTETSTQRLGMQL